MGDDTGTFLWVKLNFHEILRGIGADTVEPGEAIIQEQVVGQQQAAVIRRSAPRRIFEEEVQRRAQVADDFGCETRIEICVLRKILDVIHLDPALEEILHLRPRSRIGQHPPSLGIDLLARVQPALLCQLQKFAVRQRIPQAKREPRRGLVVIGFAVLQSQVEESRRFQCHQHHALHRVLRLGSAFQRRGHKQKLLLRRQRTSQGGRDEILAKRLNLGRAVGVAWFAV